MVCKDSLEHRVQFDVSRLKRVRWQSSKRLLYGSLVCLTVDDFENLFFATVTHRDNTDLEKVSLFSRQGLCPVCRLVLPRHWISLPCPSRPEVAFPVDFLVHTKYYSR